MKARSEDAILEELASTIGVLADASERRMDLFREARALTPPVPFRRLAEVAGVSDVAVLQALRRAEASSA